MESTLDLAALPLVGREEVVERLRLGLRTAARGRGRTVLLRGERGTGKSRLSRSLLEEAERQGFLVASGRAYRAETGVPYALVSDAFLPLLREQSPQTLNVLTRGGAQELGYLFPGLVPADGTTPPLAADGSGDVRTRVLWTFAELIRELSKRTPLLVVLEDLQWADPSSLEVCHLLARQLVDHPAFLLLTRERAPRPEDGTLAQVESSLLEQGVAEPVLLPPLSRPETGLFLKEAFGVEEVAAGEFADRLHAWTQGNPFFLEETLQALVRAGRIYRKGGVWLGWEVREMELPPSVRDAMLSRLDRLPKEIRALAELAAVLGEHVPFPHLRAVSPMAEAALLEALELLVAREVLVEGVRGDEVFYGFRQPLLRETLLAKLGLARARLLHGRIASTLEEQLGPRAREHADVLAYHHLEAGGDGMGPGGIPYLVQAGRQALERYGNNEAVRYFQGALALLDSGAFAQGSPPGVEADRMEIVRDLARVLTRLGRYEEATPLWERTARLAGERGAVEEEARARLRMGVIRSYQGNPMEALAEFERILAPDSPSPSAPLQARVRLRQGLALEELGRPEEARRILEEVLEAAQALADPLLLAQAHRALVLLNTWTGRPDLVRDHGERAMELARESGSRTVEFWTHWGLAVLEGLMGHTGPMAERVAEAERVATELRSLPLQLLSTELAIEQAAATGEWDTGIAVGEQAIALARDLSQYNLLPRLLVWTALIYLGRGEVALARPLVEEAWKVAGVGEGKSAHIHGAIPAHIGMGYLALTRGKYDEAIRIAREGLRMADEVGYTLWALHHLLPLEAEACLWKGDLARARAIGKRLKKDSAAIEHKLGLAWAQTCDALVTWLEGDSRKGARKMEAAAQSLEEVPMIPDAARLRRQLAGRLAEMGDREGALRELTRVHQIFLKLGAEVELEKTRGMFRELETRPPRKSSSGEGTLSPREVEIAELVEQRLSNKAIARELGVSVRTVSTHLSNIFQKLGLRSRGELADHVREKGLLRD